MTARKVKTRKPEAGGGYIRQSELAKLLGISARAIRKWERHGLVRRRVGGAVSYELADVLRYLYRRLEALSGDLATEKKQAEVAILKERRKLVRIKRKILTGELLKRDEVAQAEVEQIIAVRSGLEALGRAIAPAILEMGPDATVDEAERLVWDYVEPLLRAFAGERAKEVLDAEAVDADAPP